MLQNLPNYEGDSTFGLYANERLCNYVHETCKNMSMNKNVVVNGNLLYSVHR